MVHVGKYTIYMDDMGCDTDEGNQNKMYKHKWTKALAVDGRDPARDPPEM